MWAEDAATCSPPQRLILYPLEPRSHLALPVQQVAQGGATFHGEGKDQFLSKQAELSAEGAR